MLIKDKIGYKYELVVYKDWKDRLEPILAEDLLVDETMLYVDGLYQLNTGICDVIDYLDTLRGEYYYAIYPMEV